MIKQWPAENTQSLFAQILLGIPNSFMNMNGFFFSFGYRKGSFISDFGKKQQRENGNSNPVSAGPSNVIHM